MFDWHSASEEAREAELARLFGVTVEEWQEPATDDPPTETDLALLVRLANARVERQLRRVGADLGYDLGPAATHTVRLIGHAGKPLAAIAERLLVSRQAAGQVVARLVAAGLVERRESWSGTLVTRTAEGRAFVRALDAALVELARDWSAFRPAGFLEQAVPVLETMASEQRRRWG